MKFLSVILVLVSTRSLCEVNATYLYEANHCVRYYTVCPRNRVLHVNNVIEDPHSNNYVYTKMSHADVCDIITIQRAIDQSHPIFINVTVTNDRTGAIHYAGGNLNVCNNYREGSWERFAVRFFSSAIFPRRRRQPLFPVQPGRYPLYQVLPPFYSVLPNYVPNGQYLISFTSQTLARSATSRGQIIFSGLRFLMSLTPVQRGG